MSRHCESIKRRQQQRPEPPPLGVSYAQQIFVQDFEHEFLPDIQEWFEQYYSIRFRNYPVSESYLHAPEVIGERGA